MGTGKPLNAAPELYHAHSSVLKVPKNHGASFRINKCKPAANIYYVKGHISEPVSEIPKYKEYVRYVAVCTSVASGFSAYCQAHCNVHTLLRCA